MNSYRSPATRGNFHHGLRGVAFAVTSLLACNREPIASQPYEEVARRYSEAYCKAVEACGCATEQYYPTFESCQSDLETRFLEKVMPGDVVDMDCIEFWEETLLEDPCLSSELPAVTCTLATSSRPEGAACSGDFVPGNPVRQCETGLCELDECTNTPYSQKPEGTACETGFWGSCGPGMYCGADGVCHDSAEEGEQCQLGGCSPGLYCAGPEQFTGTCSPQLPPGAACNPQDYRPCDNSVEEVVWCDPGLETCEPVAPPLICTSVRLPSNFQ